MRKFIGMLTETTADAKIKVKKCIETETKFKEVEQKLEWNESEEKEQK